MRIERDEAHDERTVAGQSFHGLVGIRLGRECLAQQNQEQTKRRGIEETQLGKAGLPVGGQALSCRFGLGGFLRNAGRE